MADGTELTFDQRMEIMRSITLGSETYGEGIAYEQATRFYLEHLVDECAERIRMDCPGLPSRVDLLISVTGFSPRPTIVVCKVLQPRRLVVIPSENARGSVNDIARHVIGPTGLQQADFVQRRCTPTDPLSIYHVVKDELELLAREDERAVSYIDITGGRKVMSATAALAAWQLDLGLCYLDGEWDPVLRQAVPGRDRLLLLDNPTSLFGEQEMNAADHAFDGGAYEAARNRFDELAVRLARPIEARFWGALSRLYQAWCDLDLVSLPDAIDGVRRTLSPMQRQLPASAATRLAAQLEFLEQLVNRDPRALLLSFNLLDDHYRKVGRHDFAALFSYRTIERCLVGRLAAQNPTFDPKAPSYDLLTNDVPALRQAYRSVCDAVDGPKPGRALPRNLGVFAAAALLQAQGDAVTDPAELATATDLQELRKLAEARNQSVLAHGEESVSPKISADLNRKALRVLRAYWQLTYPGEDLDGIRAELAFLSAEDSGK
ncbi:hypothetical protein AB0I28_19390 [Phytomonospora sp. NPDC050363]|uniref:hypothetical protein n=1 Tax=Phytomonospora sp. NPDC050363 TaxID=3155642 RepID=UPI0033E2649B